MLFGVYPFDGNSDDEILKKVANGEYTFPNNIEISKTCRSIITKLLDKKPKLRIDLFDDLFDVWYEENSPDTVNIKILEEDVSKNDSTPQSKNSMLNVVLKEKPSKAGMNFSSGKNKDIKSFPSPQKNVSYFRTESKSENIKKKDSKEGIYIKNKYDSKKQEKKK
jgi:serine/threonine protein kinase